MRRTAIMVMAVATALTIEGCSETPMPGDAQMTVVKPGQQQAEGETHYGKNLNSLAYRSKNSCAMMINKSK